MTSAQLNRSRAAGRLATWSVPLLVLISFIAGCVTEQPLATPTALVSPYPDAQLWAVVPLVNESGVSTIDPARLADLLTQEIEQARGITTLPVNRVLAAMRALGLSQVSSPGEAAALMNLLQVNGLIVGSLTAYDPYPPLRLGAAIQLFRRDSRAEWADVDPRQLTRNPVGEPDAGVSSLRPTAQASGVFDTSNHQVLNQIREYAVGRTVPDSAFGSREYEVSIELFTEFVSYRLMSELLHGEQVRLIAVAKENASR